MPIDTEMLVTDLIEEAQLAAAAGYQDVALGALQEAHIACLLPDGNIYREGRAKICFAEGFFYRHDPDSLYLAIHAYDEAIEHCTSVRFEHDHFDERRDMIEESLWQIFALNFRLRQFRQAARAARRALDGVSYPDVPGKPFVRVSVLSTGRLMALTLFAGISSN